VVDLSDDETDNDNGNGILDFVDLCDLEDETEETLQEIPVPAPVPTHSTQDVLKYNIIEAPWVEIEVVELGRFQLRPGKSVELLGGDEGKPNTSFLLIKNIIRNNETQEIHLCGFSLRRNSNFGCFSPPRLNEVYLDLEENMNDCRHTYEQGIIRIPLGHVKKIRRITFTHKGVAEEPGFRKDVVLRKSQPDYEARKEFVKENEQLVCRYLIIRRYATMVEWKKQRTTETVLRRLYEDEHPLRPISEWKLKVCTPTHQQEDRIVTYGSGFCGCGGDTTGARQAGLAVKYAFDMDKRSCITFEHNHSDAICFNEEAFDMCMADDGLIPYAHIVHLSVPCKPWSPAHTRDGKDDGANIAALFATGPFLRKTKPMFHTQEQTAGLVTHHPVEFAALIRIILDEGYNVRWGRHQFVDFGLSSRRNRLIIFAAQ
jgi:DNA (cytosine-5)-methyltransferase 1